MTVAYRVSSGDGTTYSLPEVPVSRTKRAAEKLATPERVLGCPLVCLHPLCGLWNDNGVAFTPVQPISKSSAVRGCPLPQAVTYVSLHKSQAKFLWFSLSYICVWNMSIISLSCWMQRKRMVHVICCNVIAILLMLGCMIMGVCCDLIGEQDFGVWCKNTFLFYCWDWCPLWSAQAVILVLGLLRLSVPAHTCLSSCVFHANLNIPDTIRHLIMILLSAGFF